jgi:DNA-binding MarR family transcriptional regulator
MAGDSDAAVAIVSDLAALFRRQRRGLARNWCLGSVSMTHLHVLMLLDSDGPQPMGRLADALLCSLPNATGIIDRMVERGLVERVRDDGDRRLVRVSLAPRGRETLDEFEMVRQQQLLGILGAMSPQERRVCAEAFRAMREAAERLDAEAAGSAAASKRPARTTTEIRQ